MSWLTRTVILTYIIDDYLSFIFVYLFLCICILHCITWLSKPKKPVESGHKQGTFGLCIQTQHEHTVDGYNSGVTVKLPGISCNGNKVQVHGLDIVEGKINNDDVSVLRDTGCSTVFVHSKFTNTDHLIGHTRDTCLADGTVKQCPEVYINVSTPFISGDIVALILDTPFADLVVGNYVNTSVPHSIEEVPVTGVRYIFASEEPVPFNAVETRSRKKKQDEADTEIDETTERFSNDTSITHPIDFSDISQEFKICDRKQLIDLQKTDTTLDKVRSYVSEEHNENQSSYFVYLSDLLYRVYSKPSGESIHQIVLPGQLRDMIL